MVNGEDKISEMYDATADIAREHRWTAVAARYLEFGSELVAADSAVAS